jgi:hypothetical protein
MKPSTRMAAALLGAGMILFSMTRGHAPQASQPAEPTPSAALLKAQPQHVTAESAARIEQPFWHGS